MENRLNLAKYAGVDDSNFAVRFDFVDKLIGTQCAEGSRLVGIRYNQSDSLEQRKNRRDAISVYAGEIAYHAALEGRGQD